MKRTQVVSAAAALLFVATAAQAQRGQDDRHGRQNQHEQVSPPVQQRQADDSRRRVEEPQQRGIEQARAEQTRAAEIENQQRTAQHSEQQQRDLQARQHEQEQQFERTRQVEQTQQFERERTERERIERDQIEQAQRRAELNRVYDRNYRPGYDYRYNMGGVYRETNQYGVDVLRQAIDVGYQQGYRAGLVDRRDRAPADYRRAFDFENGNYGYAGSYVPQSDYSYYFREGFQRGYDDAYSNRARYGTFSNGNPSILGDIVAGILGVTLIR